MKMIKLAMLGATALALASLTPAMAADACTKLKLDLAGTTATFPVPTPMASFEPSVDTVVGLTTLSKGTDVPMWKKLDGTPGKLAWKPEEVLLGDAVDGGPKAFILAQADLDMLKYGVIKAGGSVEVDGDEALGELLTL